MNVIAAVLTGQGDCTKMKHFTIDTDNNITVYASKKAAREAGAAVFSTEEQFAELIGADNKRLVEIWNSLPGGKPVAKFANRKVATERIWKAIQGLGEGPASTAQAEEPVAENPAPATEAATEVTTEAGTDQAAAAPETDTALPQLGTESAPAQVEPEAPEAFASAEPVANVDAQMPDVAPVAQDPSPKAGRARKAPKGPKVAKAVKSEAGPREGSKTAQVVAMLQREGGATLAEIMDKMGWQKHTVRGFMAGTMKKAGYTVESFKPEGGERTYRINL
jgi:hypothetical protein